MKKGWKIFITFIAAGIAVYAAMMVMFNIKKAAINDLYRETLYSNIAFESSQYVIQIESGIRYGKKLDNYYGIDRLISKCAESSSYIWGAYVFDENGDILYRMGENRGSIPDATAVWLEGKTYAVRLWRDAEYIVLDIREESGDIIGKLMLCLESDALSGVIEEQVKVGMWQSVFVAVECALLAAILLIHILKKGRPAFGFIKAAAIIGGCALLAVGVDAAIQSIRFQDIATSYVSQSAQRVAQVVQQQVDEVSARGVSADVYDINGYLMRLQSSAENVALLRLNDAGIIQVEASQAYVDSITAAFREEIFGYTLLVAIVVGGCILLATLGQNLYLMHKQKTVRRQARAIKKRASVAAKARELLMKNELQNTMLIGCIDDEFADEIIIQGEDIRIHDMVSGVYLFSVREPEAFFSLLAPVRENAATLFINNSAIRERIEDELEEFEIHEYTHWCLHHSVALHYADIEGITFRKLGAEHVPFVLEHYHTTEFSEENIRDRVLHQNSVGAFVDGELKGFILTHYNGEIGPILILPECRGMGLGDSLTVRIARLQREAGRPCFIFALDSNSRSKNICTRVGYKRTPEDTLWIYRKQSGEAYE